MDNIAKVQKCLPDLCATLAPFPGALEGLIERAEFEIDQYDLEMDVIDFLEDLSVKVSNTALQVSDNNGVQVWSVAEGKWVEDEEGDFED